MKRNTKLVGDISEQAFILACLKRGWEVSVPAGDRMPYDCIVDSLDGILRKVQVKTAWFSASDDNYVVDVRRHRSNQRETGTIAYVSSDFDFAAMYIQDLDIWYIMPSATFVSYKSAVSLVEAKKRQRQSKSSDYREAWYRLSDVESEILSII